MAMLTTQVVNGMVKESGCSCSVFNDRMKDGRRSVKVWDWSDEQYFIAAEKLKSLGCKAEVVFVKSYNAYTGSTDTITRLYVTEPK